VLEALQAGLDDSDDEVVTEAIEALIWLRRRDWFIAKRLPDLPHRLQAVIDSERSDDLRSNAFALLVECDELAPEILRLDERSHDRDPWIACRACLKLLRGPRDPDDAFRRLVALLPDAPLRLRQQLFAALGEFRGPEAERLNRLFIRRLWLAPFAERNELLGHLERMPMSAVELPEALQVALIARAWTDQPRVSRYQRAANRCVGKGWDQPIVILSPILLRNVLDPTLDSIPRLTNALLLESYAMRPIKFEDCETGFTPIDFFQSLVRATIPPLVSESDVDD
jgi:hypothetical protein